MENIPLEKYSIGLGKNIPLKKNIQYEWKIHHWKNIEYDWKKILSIIGNILDTIGKIIYDWRKYW